MEQEQAFVLTVAALMVDSSGFGRFAWRQLLSANRVNQSNEIRSIIFFYKNSCLYPRAYAHLISTTISFCVLTS
jgi:hypothetical protein